MKNKKIYSIRGVHDFFPPNSNILSKIVQIFAKILNNYGFEKIYIPILEKTSLLKKIIGVSTNLIKKEMYTFFDKKKNSLSLRPEGTSGCARSLVQNSLLRNRIEKKFWYFGPMFRYERPQKGRYRQFYQIGIEIFGLEGPEIEAETILMVQKFWKTLGIEKFVSLEINSLGNYNSQTLYKKKLFEFYKKYKIDSKTKQEIENNPIKIPRYILSKNINKKIPKIIDFLDKRSKKHFLYLCNILDNLKIKYKINPRLYRGLNYYNDTIFEWIYKDENKRSQSVCGGGRYDQLTKKIGGYFCFAFGLAIGIERIMLIRQLNKAIKKSNLVSTDIHIFYLEKKIEKNFLILSEKIRSAFPNLKISSNYKIQKIKKCLKIASMQNTKIVILIGKKEIESNTITIKDFFAKKQYKVSLLKMKKKIQEILQINEKNISNNKK
ncbi:histidine--tRNA ligase [bacterium endosymbiont of Pedicinus badii]|uniref:histidine--tRNA ligase n=1 Tax=bacterium endosymbiont of Pedicinus badii TaxID=1719126 RepID=UPI0009B98027|nr:histidine--tRNA ligase [bacterium endosymbiont of Pedicinus badii]OQM34486.1 hypothetical protein AOQ89_01190 [bacterium endosymbiont of Pedicinus badii]